MKNKIKKDYVTNLNDQQKALLAMSLKDEANGIYDFEDDLEDWQSYNPDID